MQLARLNRHANPDHRQHALAAVVLASTRVSAKDDRLIEVGETRASLKRADHLRLQRRSLTQ
jgi:hypothetical protein